MPAMPERISARHCSTHAAMTSAQRVYLDGLWRTLGVDPRSETAQVIELRVRLAATSQTLLASQGAIDLENICHKIT